MKKILISFFALAFLLGAANVMAKVEKAPKAVDIKIHKKQVLSDEERKILDEKAKGKPFAQDKSVFTLPATGELGVPLPDGGEKYAILVGLANYTGTVNDLCVRGAATKDQFPENNTNLTQYCQDYDSMHMKDALISQYGYDSNNITLIRDGSATRANIMAAMESFKSKVGSNDEVVFFYSGHGTTGNYNLGGVADEAVDEGIYLYDGKVIWDDDLKAWADSLPAFRMVFTFDSCMAGGMNDIAKNNRVIVMSSGETQSSWTYYLGGYNTGTKRNPTYQYSEGLFAHNFVVNGMTGKLADGTNLSSTKDGEVVVEESFGYTYPIVQLKQNPVLSDNFTNDLLLGYRSL